MNETVRRFLPMVDFLEQVLGKNSEIVLHDFSDPDHAIVDIRNGIVSGRKVGGPATDLALKIMHDARYRDLPFITGYEGRGAGGKTLESATYFIRENDEIVGMLCVNTDLSEPCAPSTPWHSSSWLASTLCLGRRSLRLSKSRVFRSLHRSSSTAALPSC